MNVNHNDRIFAIVGVGDVIHVGSKDQLSDKLASLSNCSGGAAMALQASELLDRNADRKNAIAQVSKALQNRRQIRAASSFAKSAALAVAWDHIQRSDISDENKKSVLSQLHLINIDVTGPSAKIDLSDINHELRQFIDVESICQSINSDVIEPILSVADNDRGLNFDIAGEVALLKRALDDVLGPDKRITSSTYYRFVRLAGVMGIHGVGEILDMIRGYDDSEISHIATGARQGQIGRVELMMIAAMGDEFINRFPYYNGEHHRMYHRNILERLRAEGVSTGKKKPRHPLNRRFGSVRKSSKNASSPSLFDLDPPSA
ncbi:hypothetical protein [Brevundimonas lutea]|uniref:hypothetical protein n=1 Tax=Brevundimonas lutea TaxID=2293980 RepID=UPI0013CEBEA9|nr:hypothetical protein [Brevundimonas lutea]